ncbi:hypothetical protein BV98_000460 [Sphingobium herbicidovorans NBRC 16415]|uniref:Uncharacterized protein n=1 Tax=Sphingobium herbicidovorans (strain ATCC 700291 / DSM 11019 / CCUG 56400 / KCTC 2939 / LMG 18315 / NBRC 16415 / MH) TaxID=1219045 RepID=A0A086PDY6_SPHHM|nr:hypothetical protein BV98_000460 [Sphingobium herbicidovorans NBRC 16415]
MLSRIMSGPESSGRQRPLRIAGNAARRQLLNRACSKGRATRDGTQPVESGKRQFPENLRMTFFGIAIGHARNEVGDMAAAARFVEQAIILPFRRH